MWGWDIYSAIVTIAFVIYAVFVAPAWLRAWFLTIAAAVVVVGLVAVALSAA